MRVLSFAVVAEEAAATYKGSGGNVRQLDRLFDPESLARLREHARAFCFLAFHGTGDPAVADYVRAGTLADDSGPDILVLFALDQPAPVATPVGRDSLRQWMDLDEGGHPAYRMVRALFEEPHPLPGLVVFEDLALDSEVAYLPLRHLETEEAVRRELRDVFALVERSAVKAKPGKMLDALGVELRKRGSSYTRTGRRPVREWVLQGIRMAREHSGEIVTVIGMIQ